jgi:hypothetical protein
MSVCEPGKQSDRRASLSRSDDQAETFALLYLHDAIRGLPTLWHFIYLQVNVKEVILKASSSHEGRPA